MVGPIEEAVARSEAMARGELAASKVKNEELIKKQAIEAEKELQHVKTFEEVIVPARIKGLNTFLEARREIDKFSDEFVSDYNRLFAEVQQVLIRKRKTRAKKFNQAGLERFLANFTALLEKRSVDAQRLLTPDEAAIFQKAVEAWKAQSGKLDTIDKAVLYFKRFVQVKQFPRSLSTVPVKSPNGISQEEKTRFQAAVKELGGIEVPSNFEELALDPDVLKAYKDLPADLLKRVPAEKFSEKVSRTAYSEEYSRLLQEADLRPPIPGDIKGKNFAGLYKQKGLD